MWTIIQCVCQYLEDHSMDNMWSEEYYEDIAINLSASDTFTVSTMEEEEKVIAEFNLEYLVEKPKGMLNTIIYVCVCIYPPNVILFFILQTSTMNRVLLE